MEDLISILTDKDDPKAFQRTKEIAAASEFSDKYFSSLPDFASLLTHKKTYIRTRAMILCCSQARWDTNGVLREYLPQMFQLLHDDKPTVVRQSLNALKEVAVFRPELHNIIEKELETIDPAAYKDSMQPLIRKDIDELKELLEKKE